MRVQLLISDLLRNDPISQEMIARLREQMGNDTNMVLTEKNPEIIHVFGIGDAKTLRTVRNSFRLYIPLIISPMGTLQPWNRPLLPDSQMSKTLRKAESVHVCSQIELENISSLLDKKEQERKNNTSIELIINPIVSKSTDIKELANRFRSLYENSAQNVDKRLTAHIWNQLGEFEECDKTIYDILFQTVYIRYQHLRGYITRDKLDCLATTLMNSEYDEMRMAEKLRETKMETFFSQLESVMQAEGTLTEGFMPIPYKTHAPNWQIC